MPKTIAIMTSPKKTKTQIYRTIQLSAFNGPKQSATKAHQQLGTGRSTQTKGNRATRTNKLLPNA